MLVQIDNLKNNAKESILAKEMVIQMTSRLHI